MAIDSTLPIRRAALTLLKANDALTDEVPADQIYPQSPPGLPVWPFIKLGAPSVLPRRASCLDGSETSFAGHGFAKPRIVAGETVETAEDHAARIGALMAAALDGQRVAITGGTLHFRWTGSQLLQDPEESDAFHTVQNFRVKALT